MRRAVYVESGSKSEAAALRAVDMRVPSFGDDQPLWDTGRVAIVRLERMPQSLAAVAAACPGGTMHPA